MVVWESVPTTESGYIRPSSVKATLARYSRFTWWEEEEEEQEEQEQKKEKKDEKKEEQEQKKEKKHEKKEEQEVLEVDLVDDAGAGGHDEHVLEGLGAPLEEHEALVVPLELPRFVDGLRLLVPRDVHLGRG